jgi:hypothetical protein
MKTTMELPDELLHRARVMAAQRRTTLKKLVIEGLENVLSAPAPAAAVQLTPEEAEIYEIDAYGIPVLKKRGRVVTNEMVNQMREELGV